MRYYVIWVFIGVIQLTVYFYINDNPDFIFPNETGLSGLKALLPVLIMFQILRQISIKFFHREMIISMRYGRMTWYEEEDKRNMTWIEVLFTFILVGTTILFNVI